MLCSLLTAHVFTVCFWPPSCNLWLEAQVHFGSTGRECVGVPISPLGYPWSSVLTAAIPWFICSVDPWLCRYVRGCFCARPAPVPGLLLLLCDCPGAVPGGKRKQVGFKAHVASWQAVCTVLTRAPVAGSGHGLGRCQTPSEENGQLPGSLPAECPLRHVRDAAMGGSPLGGGGPVQSQGLGTFSVSHMSPRLALTSSAPPGESGV